MPHVSEFSDPIPTNASKASVYEFAAKFSKDVGFEPGRPLGMDRLLHSLGGRLVYRDRGQREDGWVPPVATMFVDGTFEIEVSSLTGERLNDRSVAQGIGHHLLHWPLASRERPHAPMRAPRHVPDDWPDGIRRAFYEACWFAFELTMPEPAFRSAWKDDEGSLAKTANRFAMPLHSVEVRARSLSLLPPKDAMAASIEAGEADPAGSAPSP